MDGQWAFRKVVVCGGSDVGTWRVYVRCGNAFSSSGLEQCQRAPLEATLKTKIFAGSTRLGRLWRRRFTVGPRE